MRRIIKHTLDQSLEDTDTLVGLAKEAAQKPLPRADVDIEYFFDLAERAGKRISPKAREEVWNLFTKTHGERIKRVEEVVTRYREEAAISEQARTQLAWYEDELRRLKEWKGPRK
jgi:hypothetical protein